MYVCMYVCVRVFSVINFDTRHLVLWPLWFLFPSTLVRRAHWLCHMTAFMMEARASSLMSLMAIIPAPKLAFKLSIPKKNWLSIGSFHFGSVTRSDRIHFSRSSTSPAVPRIITAMRQRPWHLTWQRIWCPIDDLRPGTSRHIYFFTASVASQVEKLKPQRTGSKEVDLVDLEAKIPNPKCPPRLLDPTAKAHVPWRPGSETPSPSPGPSSSPTWQWVILGGQNWRASKKRRS